MPKNTILWGDQLLGCIGAPVVVYPIIHGVSIIQSGAGLLPSIVCFCDRDLPPKCLTYGKSFIHSASTWHCAAGVGESLVAAVTLVIVKGGPSPFGSSWLQMWFHLKTQPEWSATLELANWLSTNDSDFLFSSFIQGSYTGWMQQLPSTCHGLRLMTG